jgi:Methyltransferase domain
MPHRLEISIVTTLHASPRFVSHDRATRDLDVHSSAHDAEPLLQTGMSPRSTRLVRPNRDQSLDYTYSDPGDALAAAFMSAATSDTRGWIERDHQLLQQISMRTERKVAIDFGTGQGRLIPMLASLWSQVVAYDPDVTRLSQARDFCRRLQLQNVNLTSELDEIPVLIDGGPSLVLCSHVLQHIPSQQVPGLVQSLSNLSGNESRILLFLSGRARRARYYIAGTCSERPHEAIEVPRELFDQWTADGRQGLPVAHLETRGIVALLIRSGRRVIGAQPYRSFSFQLRVGESVECMQGKDWWIEAE